MENGVNSFSWLLTYLRTIQNLLTSCWVSSERSMPFGLLVCTPVDRASDSVKLFILVGLDRSSFVCCLVNRGSTDDLILLQISRGVVWQSMDL